MGLFDFLDELLGNKKTTKNKNDNNETDDLDDLYCFEDCCENCGELLEDCSCEDQELSRQDLSWDFNNDEDESQDDKNEGLSFDSFNSFDSDDNDDNDIF